MHWLEEELDRLALRRSYGGALAYNYWGPPRLTQDIDLLLLVPDLKAPALVEALARAGARHGNLGQRPVDLDPVLADFRGKAHLAVFLVRGVRTEVFVHWHPFHHRVLARSLEREFGSRRIRIHAAEDLIVFMKIFDRPKDLTDIRAILLAQKGRLDLDLIRTEAAQLLTDASLEELSRMLSA